MGQQRGLDAASKSAITGFITKEDDIGTVESPFGKVQLVQLIGVKAEEIEQMKNKTMTPAQLAEIFFPGADLFHTADLRHRDICNSYCKTLPANTVYIIKTVSAVHRTAHHMTTINKFFENNLNVSETSRQLFIHRNTLVYRIEKLQKATGLDIRTFEDAMTFKIAMMVVNYMKYLDTLEY